MMATLWLACKASAYPALGSNLVNDCVGWFHLAKLSVTLCNIKAPVQWMIKVQELWRRDWT